MAQTKQTTGVSKPRTSIEVYGDYCWVAIEVITPKVKSLESFVVRMATEKMVQDKLDLMAAIAAKESGFDDRIEFRDVRRRIISLRSYILNLPCMRENKFLSAFFKKAFKEELTSSCKAYYRLCKKSHQQQVNELLNELFVFDVRTNSILPLK